MKFLDKYNELDSKILSQTIGGSFWSQARDTAWGAFDGWYNHRRRY